MTLAYYNEFDPFAAMWLRALIARGHIAPGVVDERSIEDVTPNDLRGFTQCHFFAGIGVWPHSLRLAGWPDNRPVWTASCPCQPFSTAGKSAGFDDERHLWPAFYHLLEQCRPTIVFGEQVASKAVEPWIDLVHADMEAMGYAFGCVPFPSAGVGAPHIRDRAYWVADARREGSQRRSGALGAEQRAHGQVDALCAPNRLADSTGERRDRVESPAEPAGRVSVKANVPRSGVGDTDNDGLETRRETAETARYGHSARPDGSTNDPAPANGFWRDADWLGCRDGKWRPVEPGAFPLVNGVTNRVGRLRGYGNALNAQAAAAWISAYLADER